MPRIANCCAWSIIGARAANNETAVHSLGEVGFQRTSHAREKGPRSGSDAHFVGGVGEEKTSLAQMGCQPRPRTMICSFREMLLT